MATRKQAFLWAEFDKNGEVIRQGSILPESVDQTIKRVHKRHKLIVMSVDSKGVVHEICNRWGEKTE
jgi:hypothetical protein